MGSINWVAIATQCISQLPLSWLRQRKTGITSVIQEVFYTSKASALDNDAIPEYKADAGSNVVPIFSGKRIKRGLYQFTKGAISADINDSLNILRKETG